MSIIRRFISKFYVASCRILGDTVESKKRHEKPNGFSCLFSWRGDATEIFYYARRLSNKICPSILLWVEMDHANLSYRALRFSAPALVV